MSLKGNTTKNINCKYDVSVFILLGFFFPPVPESERDDFTDNILLRRNNSFLSARVQSDL